MPIATATMPQHHRPRRSASSRSSEIGGYPSAGGGGGAASPHHHPLHVPSVVSSTPNELVASSLKKVVAMSLLMAAASSSSSSGNGRKSSSTVGTRSSCKTGGALTPVPEEEPDGVPIMMPLPPTIDSRRRGPEWPPAGTASSKHHLVRPKAVAAKQQGAGDENGRSSGKRPSTPDTAPFSPDCSDDASSLGSCSNWTSDSNWTASDSNTSYAGDSLYRNSGGGVCSTAVTGVVSPLARFKVVDADSPHGNATYRIRCPADVNHLFPAVASKLGNGVPGSFQLTYVDSEGDTIVIGSDDDVRSLVEMTKAGNGGRRKKKIPKIRYSVRMSPGEYAARRVSKEAELRSRGVRRFFTERVMNGNGLSPTTKGCGREVAAEPRGRAPSRRAIVLAAAAGGGAVVSLFCIAILGGRRGKTSSGSGGISDRH